MAVEGVITSIRGVRIVALEHGKVVFKVQEGIRHCATVATILLMTALGNITLSFGSVAINKLLLREGFKFTGSNKVGTFEGANGGKGPARAATCLVLDCGDSTSFNPINVLGRGPRPRSENFGLF